MERLSGLVVKQRELVQELRSKLSDSSQPQSDAQREVERLSETVVKQRELIQELRGKLDGGAQPQSDQQQEVERLSETVVKQRELIQQLRAQQVTPVPAASCSSLQKAKLHGVCCDLYHPIQVKSLGSQDCHALVMQVCRCNSCRVMARSGCGRKTSS